MVMVAMSFVGGLKAGLQAGKSLLRIGKIAGLQGANQVLIIRVRLAVIAEELAGGSPRIALDILLESCQRALGAGEVSGLERAADGLKILDELIESVPVCGLIGAGIR